MRFSIIACVVGLLGLGSSVPWPRYNVTDLLNSTLSAFPLLNGTHNGTHNNTHDPLPEKYMQEIEAIRQEIKESVYMAELLEAIDDLFNRTRLVRRSDPRLA